MKLQSHNKNQGLLCVISAPSGTGKTTVTNGVISILKKEFPINKVVTYTSRPARRGEVDGEDYHFTSEEDFLGKKSKNFFFETTEYSGKFYGSPNNVFKEVLYKGASFILITDWPGAAELVKKIPDALLIWLSPPNMDVLQERLKKRGTETQKEIQRRLAFAQEEIAKEAKENLFHYHVVSDDLSTTIEEVCSIIRQEYNHRKGNLS